MNPPTITIGLNGKNAQADLPSGGGGLKVVSGTGTGADLKAAITANSDKLLCASIFFSDANWLQSSYVSWVMATLPYDTTHSYSIAATGYTVQSNNFYPVTTIEFQTYSVGYIGSDQKSYGKSIESAVHAAWYLVITE